MDVHELELYVCRRLKQERERLGYSQMTLAYESGVSQNMITYIETGKRTPTLNTLLKLCTAMKSIRLCYFLRPAVYQKIRLKKQSST